MAAVVTLTASDGSTVRFIDEVKALGGVKDVMFSPDETYVVAFYRGPADAASRERLLEITGRYRERIFGQAGGEYLKNLYCWPTAVVEYAGRLGVVVPFYRACCFTARVSSSSTAAATTTGCWAFGAGKKSANGSRARGIARAFSIRASWATGCATCGCA